MSQFIRHRQLDNSEPFDFKQIFIGREEQLADFERVLGQWQQVMFDQAPTEEIATDIPSPNNKLQGLVVMLYGRGGFGKSTLLYRYLAIAKRANEYNGFFICEPIVWDDALDGTRRAAYNPAPGQSIDFLEYCKMLCAQLAPKLKREPKDFRLFQQVATNVEKAKKDAVKVLEEVTRDPKDDRFKDIRGATIEVVATAVSLTIPGSKLFVDNTIVKSGANALLKLTGEQAQYLYQRFQHRLGDKLDYLLDPARRLAIALGSDLQKFALNHPLLIFFDTYEEIDEGDALLRVIMGAAGSRVGWVIAGRDNLWSGPGQRKRSIVLEHGYREITILNRSLSVNFNSEDVGAFTASNVKEYFEQVCKLFPCSPRLNALTDMDIQHILEVTNGIPLAINIAAALYSETNDIARVTEDVTNRKDMIDQMVARYLLHTRIDESERGNLYALAMLRRNTQRPILAVALGLSDEEAKEPVRFDEALSHLHRRYSFIFTEQGDPSLHQEVRKYLRLWLLERHDQPDILAINEQLRETHQAALDKLEKQRTYTGLKDRLEDEEWRDVYLDLVEQHYWLDPVEGVRRLLPFMIVASIYQRKINKKNAEDIGSFFAPCLLVPYKNWWEEAKDTLVDETSRYDFWQSQRTGLETLLKLIEQKRLNAPSPFEQETELKAALWWRLGEAYHDSDERQALVWYDKALQHLAQEKNLKEVTAELCCAITKKLYYEKKYVEMIDMSDRAISLKQDYAWAYSLHGLANYEQRQYTQAITDYSAAIRLNPDYATAYYNRGLAYYDQQQYPQAIDNYGAAIRLNPGYADAYNNRGLAYYNQQQYPQAIDDYGAAIHLNPDYADAYYNRGLAYYDQQQYTQAIDDYSTAIHLNPNYANAYQNRGLVYHTQQQYTQAIDDYDAAIRLKSDYADAYYSRGVAYHYQQQYTHAIDDYGVAIRLKPDDADAYYSRGVAHLWLKNVVQAQSDFVQSAKLAPDDVNKAWVVVFVSMTKERSGVEVAKQLETIATIAPLSPQADLCSGIAFALRGKIKDGLMKIEEALRKEGEFDDGYFWKGLLYAYYYRTKPQTAMEAIEKALEYGLPPVELTPLYWLEKDNPTFFEQYARPLLERYGV